MTDISNAKVPYYCRTANAQLQLIFISAHHAPGSTRILPSILASDDKLQRRLSGRGQL